MTSGEILAEIYDEVHTLWQNLPRDQFEQLLFLLLNRIENFRILYGHPGAPKPTGFLPARDILPPLCRCRLCGKEGFAEDEFTSPFTGFCVACSQQQGG